MWSKKHGRVVVYIAKRGKRFRQEVIENCLVARANVNLHGPLVSTVHLYPPDRRTRDMDNFAGKALYDALQHARVYGNDAQVREQHHYWGKVVSGGKCVVELQPLANQQTQFNQMDLVG